MNRMGRTDQLVRYSDGRYLTFDPAEVAGCSAAPYATDTRQSAQLHSLRASRLSPPTPPHYARACVLRWDVWMVRSSQTSTYCACAGGRGAEADLRHVSVSERPTTDIRETCTYNIYFYCLMCTFFSVIWALTKSFVIETSAGNITRFKKYFTTWRDIPLTLARAFGKRFRPSVANV